MRAFVYVLTAEYTEDGNRDSYAPRIFAKEADSVAEFTKMRNQWRDWVREDGWTECGEYHYFSAYDPSDPAQNHCNIALEKVALE